MFFPFASLLIALEQRFEAIIANVRRASDCDRLRSRAVAA